MIKRLGYAVIVKLRRKRIELTKINLNKIKLNQIKLD